MPFDGNLDLFADSRGRLSVIGYLERGLARVTAGYCSMSFHKPQRWYRRVPKFCMVGALHCSDAGHWENAVGSIYTRLKAEEFLKRFTRGRSLVDYGTAPFAKWRVVRAYRLALVAARIELAQEETMPPD